MARQSINIGTSANKGDGDPLRTAFTKINSNFSELYAGNFVEPTALNSSLIANADGTLSLGSSSKQWQNLYVKDFIYLDGKRISMSAGGALMVNNGIVQVTDVVGSVFADDSKMMMDALTGTLFGPMIGDVTGSVFADDSTVMVDAVAKLFIGNLVGDVTGNVTGDVTGTVSSIANHSTTNLAEGTNLYYTDARADARIVNAGSANWNTAYGWGDHSSAGYLTSLGTALVDADFDSAGIMATNGSGTYSIVTDNSSNWNTAYGWGDHSVAGYLTSVPAQTFASLTGKPTTVAGYGITDAHTGTFDGEVTGSVFGDDSTLLVDGNNNKIVGPVLSSDLRSTTSNVRIGLDAGLTNQGTYSIAIGERAGNLNQSADGIAIGYAAGRDDQQTDGIAIGQNAGQVNQGASSVAIGTMVGKTNQHANTIMLSATGATFNSTQANALFVKPIRSATMTTILGYDETSGEITHNAAIPGYINIADLKTLVAASTDFTDYQTRIAAL